MFTREQGVLPTRLFLNPHAVKLANIPKSPLEHHAEIYAGYSPQYYSYREIEGERRRIARHCHSLLKESMESYLPHTYPVKGLFLTGSFAHGNAHTKSDIDLIALLTHEGANAEYEEFADNLSKATKRKVDVPAIISTASDTLLEKGLFLHGDLLVYGYYLFTFDANVKRKINSLTRAENRLC
jgi:predicted nucleotidyltransferase